MLPPVVRLSFAIIILGALGIGCGRHESPNASATPPGKRPVPVVTAQSAQRDIPLDIQTIGTVEANSTVSVKAQVNGELIKVHFTEGQMVKKGDILFSIDPRPFEADLREAQANLAKSQTNLKLARDRLARYEDLQKSGVVPEDKTDEIRTLVESLTTSVKAEEAVIESIKLELDYCTIRSPIDGHAGSLLVHAGNLVKANDTAALVEINQTQPIHVSFTVPERHFLDIRKFMQDGELPVRARIPGNETITLEGKLVFIDNAIDKSAGTIRLKALFSNESECLWPGQFVNVTLTLTTQYNRVLVPSEAVQISQDGPYVYVVKPDMSAEFRLITTDRILGDETVVLDGLQAGETVVVDGHSRLVPGSLVEVKNESKTAAVKEEQS